MMGFNFPMPNDIPHLGNSHNVNGFPPDDQDYFTQEGGVQGQEALRAYTLQNFFFFAGSRPPKDDDFQGTLQTVFMNSYYPYYLRDYDYIELRDSCIGKEKPLLAKYFYIFIKKRGGQLASSQTVFENSTDFARFEIPKQFRDQVGETLQYVVPFYHQPIGDTWTAIKKYDLEALKTSNNTSVK